MLGWSAEAARNYSSNTRRNCRICCAVTNSGYARETTLNIHRGTSTAAMSTSGMDHVVNMMAAMNDGPVCAVVTCYQLNSGDVPARCGSRAVRASPESIAGMTVHPVHFVSCDVCHAVVLHVGVKGASKIESARLAPCDPRAKLLCEVTSAEPSAGWGKPMSGPARVLGIVNVHSAAKMSEVGCMCCFNCGAGRQG